MNAELKKTHSGYVIFKRGFDYFLGDNDALKLPNTALKWDGLEASKNVSRKLLLRAQKKVLTIHSFTLTCNVSGLFRLKPLFNAISGVMTKEAKKYMRQSFSVL